MFNYPQIDRHAQIRNDPENIQRLALDTSRQTILWFEEKVFTLNNALKLFDSDEISKLVNLHTEDATLSSVYLGKHDNQPYFAYHLKAWSDEFDRFQLVNLRTAGMFVERFHLGLLFYAQGLFNWHKTHRFCAMCGANTIVCDAGHARRCNNPKCARQHFPRIEPAVIFAITNREQAHSKLLLARQANWDPGRYSVLAGFVEAGESLENAVRREGMEEVGLAINEVRYIASQPWPFPSSLMLGFECTTSQSEINLLDDEIEKAVWVTASELKAQLKSGQIKLPFSVSISWHLIDRWYQSETGESLNKLVG